MFLAYSKPLREFCGFTKIPDASKITRFKQDFLDYLQLVFDKLVDLAKPIYQAIDDAKAAIAIFDSSRIEAFVNENNPKKANRIIKQLKAYSKAMGFDKSYDSYKNVYSAIPSHVSANTEIKQLCINGHFCYVFKFGITNILNSSTAVTRYKIHQVGSMRFSRLFKYLSTLFRPRELYSPIQLRSRNMSTPPYSLPLIKIRILLIVSDGNTFSSRLE